MFPLNVCICFSYIIHLYHLKAGLLFIHLGLDIQGTWSRFDRWWPCLNIERVKLQLKTPDRRGIVLQYLTKLQSLSTLNQSV